VADHRPRLVIRVDPPVLTPRWWAALFVVEPWVRLVGADGTWQVNGLKWGQTFTVDAPPGAFTLKFWFAHTLPTARLDVVLNVDGTLYVTWEAPWWPVFRGRIRWQPRVPDGVAVDGHLLVEKVPTGGGGGRSPVVKLRRPHPSWALRHLTTTPPTARRAELASPTGRLPRLLMCSPKIG
jgi:hypothetical protein